MARSANPQKVHTRKIGALQRSLLYGDITLVVDGGEEGMIGVLLAPLEMRRITDKEREQLGDGRQVIRRADGTRWLVSAALKSTDKPLLYEALTSLTSVNRGELPDSPEEFGDYVLRLDPRHD